MTKFAGEMDVHYTTASRYLLQLAEMCTLREAVVVKYHLFANHQLLSILRAFKSISPHNDLLRFVTE